MRGSVGRAVASDTRGPRFEFIYIEHLFTVNCVLKRREKKEAGNGPFKKTIIRTDCALKEIHYVVSFKIKAAYVTYKSDEGFVISAGASS